MPIQNYPTVFDCTEMTAAVNKLPARPFFFKPLFEVKGVKTTTVSLDIRKGRIVLIGDSERNTAPESLAGRGAKREWKHLSCAHLAQMDTLAPEDLQDVRAFGSTEPISVAAVYNDKMQQLKDNLAATMEFHRLGAIKGVVLDADGTTVLHDIFNTFGATKKTLDISFPKTAADDANPILTSILKAKRHVEAAMGGTPFDRRSAVLSGTGQVRDVVSRSRGAIGYISLGFVDSLNAKTSVKAVSVNHVEASEKTVASGGYPISRDLYFFVKGTPSQQAQDYIDYVTSEKMDKQIREAGFIPVTNDGKGSE